MRPSESRQLRPVISANGFPFGHVEAGVVEFVAADEIDSRRRLERFRRQNRDMGSDHADLRVRVLRFDRFGALNVVRSEGVLVWRTNSS